MIDALTLTLKAILDNSSLPASVRDAEVAFDRPGDTYAPDKDTINLFLYDVREKAELRSSEPIIARQDGMATIRRPPIRLACSYLVTAWIISGVSGEQAILAQHQLLGEVLRVFAGMPFIEDQYLQGALTSQPYPVPLLTGQGELMRNPAEFWSALGGKLQPSLTLTAIIALDPLATPMSAPLVTTHRARLGERRDDRQEALKPSPQEVFYSVGGVVLDADGQPIEGCMVTLQDSGITVQTGADGRFRFGNLGAGRHRLSAISGTKSEEVEIQVPAPQRADYSIQFS